MTTAIENPDPRDELLATALGHARRGWRVFPLRPGDKRPAVRDWEARATTDPTRIERAWRADRFNIGIACGPSGLVVVDLDRPKPGQVPPPAYRMPGVRDGGDVLAVLCEANDQPLPVDTYTVRTASGGTHLYYAAPAPLPGWLTDRLTDPDPAPAADPSEWPRAETGNTTAYAAAALRGELDR